MRRRRAPETALVLPTPLETIHHLADPAGIKVLLLAGKSIASTVSCALSWYPPRCKNGQRNGQRQEARRQRLGFLLANLCSHEEKNWYPLQGSNLGPTDQEAQVGTPVSVGSSALPETTLSRIYTAPLPLQECASARTLLQLVAPTRGNRWVTAPPAPWRRILPTAPDPPNGGPPCDVPCS